MPKPPPGYKHNRTKGFPLADLDTLFGHVLNTLGPELATAKNSPPAERNAAGEGQVVGSKRAREAVGDGSRGKRRSGENANASAKGGVALSEQGASSMEVDAGADQTGPGSQKKLAGVAVKSEAKPETEPVSDPVQEGLDASKKAFSRLLGVWEGVAMEGKRELHQKVVARLGRMLAEAEATALAQGIKASETEVGAAHIVVCVWSNSATRLYFAQ